MSFNKTDETIIKKIFSLIFLEYRLIISIQQLLLEFGTCAGEGEGYLYIPLSRSPFETIPNENIRNIQVISIKELRKNPTLLSFHHFLYLEFKRL